MAHPTVPTSPSNAERENKIIYLTKKQYDALVKRIDQLETAQTFNQQIINHLTYRMNHLEQLYVNQSQQRPNAPNTQSAKHTTNMTKTGGEVLAR